MSERQDNVIPMFTRRGDLEPWRDKHAVAGFLGCHVSWVEHHKGLREISRMIAGRRKWRLSEVDRYLEQEAS